jgi:prepilin-type N-terminal cleavage/methylation domain-containing protein
MFVRRQKTLFSGFTLLELILVMVILCTVLAMVSPSLRGFFSSRQINQVGEQILLLTRYTKTCSVSSGNYYRICFDLDKNTYWLSALTENEYVQLENTWGRSFVIPSDIHIRFQNVPQQGGRYYLEYNPQGYGRECKLRLEDSKDNRIVLTQDSPAEDFILVELKKGDDTWGNHGSI